MNINLGDTNIFANQVRDLINKISQNYVTYEKACGEVMGVTTSQAGAILAFPIKGGLTMNELSKAVSLEISTMTRMVDQLVEKGLVQRENDAKDRRVVRVALTEAGRKLRKRLEDALQSFYSNSLENIQVEKRENIISQLQQINAAIASGLDKCCKEYSQSIEEPKG
jgi:DNA-binding MarR family transcriptional regulator